MTQLISLDNVSLAFGLDLLLDRAKLDLSKGERVCLIGRNGAGKSSLFKIIEGTLAPDEGTVWRKPALRLARLAQELPLSLPYTVFEYVAEGLAEVGKSLAAYHIVAKRLATRYVVEDLALLERLQHDIDVKQGWHLDQKIESILNRLQLNAETKLVELSGGWQRRAALARALVGDPELLLLDEPTNHLDIEAIKWLEDELMNCNLGLFFITHDRALLQRLASRIVELDRGNLTSWPGDYVNFLRRKEAMLEAESKQQAEFDKKLAQEEKWIRQGIKARRTRNEGRVRALEAMRSQRAQRRTVQGKANFNLNDAEKSGDLVIEAVKLDQQYQGVSILKNFSLRIMRGDRIGLIGPNGVGKTTLLNLLLKHNEPQAGIVRHGTKLKIAYFDQLRAALDLEKTVAENVTYGNELVEINGHQRHIISYLSDFLFSPQRTRTPVKALSGGECNRLLLARIFSQPTNVLVLDEPTNDLDIETLELLEALLCEYQGTLLIVSHDRAFLDNVVTSTLVFEGQGCVVEYVGGYQDYLKQRQPILKESSQATQAVVATVEQVRDSLSYHEKKELAILPKKIQDLEREQEKIQLLIAEPNFYQQAKPMIDEALERLKALHAELEQAYVRWELLEKKNL